MRLSESFTKPLRQPPKDADTVNHALLSQAGFVHQLMAGVYSYLPFGLRVLRKIETIVREEMDSIGGQELLMPVLHPKENWQKTGGWDSVDVLFKLKSRTDREYALGQSEEEIVTPLVMPHIESYKDLPAAVYQIHWKFRDELRSKSGILRGREFFMKDMYSFHADQEDFDRFYAESKQAYLKVYERLGLTAKVTEASGGNFTEKISYEFMILTDAGEDDILYCEQCDFCVNVEIAKEKQGNTCPRCKKGKLQQARASEVGNVFDLGQKYTKDFGLSFTDRQGKKEHPIMGCYGLGISRLMGVVVEKSHDDHGIIWPEAIAPFAVHLVALGDDKDVRKAADKLYADLDKAGTEVLYDDRDESAGVKFNDADLIGIPNRVTVSQKTIDQQSAELKRRDSKETELVGLKDIVKKLA
ncbi:MAG: aminoacyl--tRNA ligase-related protein [bacterium]|nr:aminoacyl--tRNA ligase-related protein [bacterium]MDZ4248129.1 aminoacyl--tRNA ligase-related protein [Patescibacteria group bacterium]